MFIQHVDTEKYCKVLKKLPHSWVLFCKCHCTDTCMPLCIERWTKNLQNLFETKLYIPTLKPILT